MIENDSEHFETNVVFFIASAYLQIKYFKFGLVLIWYKVAKMTAFDIEME